MKTKTIELSNFVANHYTKDWKNSVIDVAGYLGASNGTYLIIETGSKNNFYGFPKFGDITTVKSSDSMETKLLEIIKNPDSFHWKAIQEIDEDRYRDCDKCDFRGNEIVYGGDCKECNGEGELDFESEHNLYTVTCKSCDGASKEAIGRTLCSVCNGTKKSLSFIPINDKDLGNDQFALNGKHVQKFNLYTSNLRFAWRNDWELFAATFDGGVAIVYPMRT